MAPPPNDDIQNAEVLVINGGPQAGTIVDATVDPWEGGSTFVDVWYSLTNPGGTDLTVRLTISETGGDPGFSPSMYVTNFSAIPPSSWSDEIGTFNDGDDDSWWYFPWCGDDADVVDGAVVVLAGTTVYILVADNSDDTRTGSFTIEAFTPAETGDDVADAIEVPAGTTVVQTVDLNKYSVEFDEFMDTVLGSETKQASCWFHVPVGGPGQVYIKVRSLTACEGGDAVVEWFYATGGPASGYSDLTYDSASAGWLNITFPGAMDANIGFKDVYGKGTDTVPPFNHGDLTPLVGGEDIYLRFSSDDGAILVIEVYNTATINCIDATTLINGSSTTASVVSGAVRESQSQFDASGEPSDGTQYISEITDEVATLLFDETDIPDGPGLYSVYVKAKNKTGGAWAFGLKRNGLALYPPGVPEDSDFPADFTPSTTSIGPITNYFGNDDTPLKRLNWLRGLPVFVGDEYELVVSNEDTFGDTIDITDICFQKLPTSTPASPDFDLIEMNDVPLGDSYGTWGIRTYTPTPHTGTPEVVSADFCITDDGKIWVVYIDEHVGIGNTFGTGPVLKMWNGATWTTISSNVSGLITADSDYNNYAQPSNSKYWTDGASIDTDGTDIFIAMSLWDGTKTVTDFGGATAQKNFRCLVRKYNVGGASFSTIGTPFDSEGEGAVSRTWNNPDTGAVRAQAPRIRISPAGVLWVAFTDNEDTESTEFPGTWSGSVPAYMSHWNGSNWIVDRLPDPTFTISDPILSLDFISNDSGDRTQVDFCFRHLGDSALGEDPAAIYSGTEEGSPGATVQKQWIVYSEFSSGTWTKVFEGAIDDWVPDHLEVLSPDFVGPTEGHWCQGVAMYATDTATYFAGATGFDLNGIDEMVCERLKEDGSGFDPTFTKSPPGLLAGTGAGFSDGFSPWVWDLHSKSMAVDANGFLFFSWWASNGYEETGLVAVQSPTCDGWHLASMLNDGIGDTNFSHAGVPLLPSNDGETIYAFGEFSRGINPSPGIFVFQLGVFAFPVDEAAYSAELCPLGGLVSMNWRSSDRSASTKRVLTGG